MVFTRATMATYLKAQNTEGPRAAVELALAKTAVVETAVAKTAAKKGTS